MIGLGIDAVDVARFRGVLERRPGIVERIFTVAERAPLEARADRVPGLAARFAAKEAAMKALGAGIGQVSWQELEVIRAASGEPSLHLSGRAAGRAFELGVSSMAVSLTHTASLAAAVVVTA